MKEVEGTKYYSKAEIQQLLGCSLATINARICATRIKGYYLGRQKHYTADQVKELAEYRKDPQKL